MASSPPKSAEDFLLKIQGRVAKRKKKDSQALIDPQPVQDPPSPNPGPSNRMESEKIPTSKEMRKVASPKKVKSPWVLKWIYTQHVHYTNVILGTLSQDRCQFQH